MEKTAQQRCFGHSDFYVNCDHHPVRYDKVAEALDCFGAFVQTPDELKKALKDAVDSNLPAVLHVAVDKVANISPPGAELWVGSHTTK